MPNIRLDKSYYMHWQLPILVWIARLICHYFIWRLESQRIKWDYAEVNKWTRLKYNGCLFGSFFFSFVAHARFSLKQWLNCCIALVNSFCAQIIVHWSFARAHPFTHN